MNSRIWGNQTPNEFLEWERDTPNANVWLGMTGSEVYGPLFFQRLQLLQKPFRLHDF